MTVSLFRPVGLAELSLIWDSDMRGFPPRLPHQPFFYPVANMNPCFRLKIIFPCELHLLSLADQFRTTDMGTVSVCFIGVLIRNR